MTGMTDLKPIGGMGNIVVDNEMNIDHIGYQLERLKVILMDWANWQKGYKPNIGWRSRSIGLVSGYVSKTFDDMCDEADTAMYRNIDAAIGDLTAPQSAAINRCYGIASVFRFPRNNYQECLIEAHLILMKTLPAKGVNV